MLVYAGDINIDLSKYEDNDVLSYSWGPNSSTHATIFSVAERFTCDAIPQLLSTHFHMCYYFISVASARMCYYSACATISTLRVLDYDDASSLYP